MCTCGKTYSVTVVTPEVFKIVTLYFSDNNDKNEDKRPERWYHFFGRATEGDWKVICKI